MKTKKKKQLKKLKKSVKCKLNVLRESDLKSGKFKPSHLEFSGYWDLFYTIESLLNICIIATQGDEYNPSKIKSPEENIRKCLELARDLMPFEEGEFLDEAYQLLNR